MRHKQPMTHEVKRVISLSTSTAPDPDVGYTCVRLDWGITKSWRSRGNLWWPEADYPPH